MEEVGREVVPEEEMLMFLASGPRETILVGRAALFTRRVLALC